MATLTVNVLTTFPVDVAHLPGQSRLFNDHTCTDLSIEPEAKYRLFSDIATVVINLKIKTTLSNTRLFLINLEN